MIEPNVKTYSEQLKKLGIEHSFLEHPEMVEVVDVYNYFHCDATNGLSTLVIKADNTYVSVIRRDDCKLDYEKVKTILGVKNLGIASDEEFEKLTGLQHGAAHVVMPVTTTLLDEKLFEKEYLMGGSGSLSVTIKYKAFDLKKIPGAKIVSITSIKEKLALPVNKRIVSGITPSGDGSLHIGNYLGAVKQFIDIAKQNQCFLFVADLHALTTVQDKKMLEKNKQTLILNELALLSGFGKMDNIIFFDQSELPHAELQCIINNVTPLGLLKRAHAYKDKLAKDVSEEDINLGLFNYPILMAADILLYKPDIVPVGKDQKQHIEIARDIAERFNKIYKTQLFKLPEPYIPEGVATILGTDGKRKMSKSLGNLISIFEDEKVIHKQVMSCYTDPTRAKATDPGHIEGNMVFAYLDHFGDKKTVDDMKSSYQAGKLGDVEAKEYLYESLMKTFAPARTRYAELKNDPKKVKDIMDYGTQKAREVATKTMAEVREAIGLKTQYSIAQMVNSSKVKESKSLSIEPSALSHITIDELTRIDLRVGRVENATHPEKSEKLIRLEVNFGDEIGKRIIFTGVRLYGYAKDDFIGKQFFFVTNLLPRKMIGEESQGMILAVDGEEKQFGEMSVSKPVFVSAEGMPLGAKIR